MADNDMHKLIQFFENRDKQRDIAFKEMFAHKEGVASGAIHSVKDQLSNQLTEIKQQVINNGRRHDIANGRLAKIETEHHELDKAFGSFKTGIKTDAQNIDANFNRRVTSLEKDRRWLVLSIMGVVLMALLEVLIAIPWEKLSGG